MCRYCDVDGGSDEAMLSGLAVHTAQMAAAKAIRRLEKAITAYSEALPDKARPRTLDFLKDVVKIRRRLNRVYAGYRPGEPAVRSVPSRIPEQRVAYPPEFDRVAKGDLLVAAEAGRYFQRVGPGWIRPSPHVVSAEAPAVYEMRIDAVSPRRGLYRYSSRIVWPNGTAEVLKTGRTAVLQTLIEEMDGGHLLRTFEG